MNKKGLTVVEFIVSFAITVTISIFLLQIVLSLAKIYNNNGKKTEILNKQSIISDTINTKFLDNEIISISNCGNNCYNFNYLNGGSSRLSLNENTLTFDSMVINIESATFKSINLDVVYTPTVQQNVNDGILILTIPITSDLDYNFDIRIAYQFNLNNSLIDEYFSS